MKPQDFSVIVNNRIERIRNVLSTKALEYSSNLDRLGNFKRAAAIQQDTPEAALIGMFSKHMVSILDAVDSIESIDRSMDFWDEKLSDAINYLILLEALVFERKANVSD